MVAQIDKTYRSYGLGRSVRRLVSYLFEGRPHTTKGQWFNPVVFFILRCLQLIPGKPKVEKPVFITGLGRSGTTILGVILSLHKDVGYLNEPKAIWTTADPRHDINGDYTESGGIYRLGGGDAAPQRRIVLNRVFSRYLATVRARRLVDKYPELIFRVDYLLHAFENPRIIFISRCGVDAVHSIDLWSQRFGTVHRDGTDDWWGRNDIKWKYLQEQILLPDPKYASVRALVTKNLDHVNRAALEWVVSMREGIHFLEKYPNAIHHVSYEALVQNPKRELTTIFDHCDLAEDHTVLDYATRVLYKTPPKPWPKLHPLIDDLFRETMIQLGYENLTYENE